MSYEVYRAQKLREGAEFQDFIMERLHLIGTILQPYTSARGQQKGENIFGLEIKNDQQYQATGNLYIEVAEKARPREGDYVKSGIFRSDNTWLYGIGDRLTFWIFAKSTLRNLYAHREQWKLREPPPTQTSKGFLIPVALADKLNARRIQFNFEGGIKIVEQGGHQSVIDLASIETPPECQMHLQIK